MAQRTGNFRQMSPRALNGWTLGGEARSLRWLGSQVSRNRTVRWPLFTMNSNDPAWTTRHDSKHTDIDYRHISQSSNSAATRACCSIRHWFCHLVVNINKKILIPKWFKSKQRNNLFLVCSIMLYSLTFLDRYVSAEKFFVNRRQQSRRNQVMPGNKIVWKMQYTICNRIFYEPFQRYCHLCRRQQN